ncbi:MAG: hypothetical protein JXA16_11130 [Bacteroidales bacterium]|nr:hypothetical protein [Bacteroidales bacterium]
MSKSRNYNFKDVDMLMASKTVMESFKTNLSELSTVRTNWTEHNVNALSTKIDNAIDSYLGIDSKKELRNATEKVLSIQAPAKRDLSFFKSQIDVDFTKDSKKKTEILKNLGFAKLLRDVQKGNQESLIELLFTFKRHMNDKLKNEIIAKGTDVKLIDQIIGYADVLKLADVTQEALKGTTKEITTEAIQVFNEIYDEIIGICKIASNYYMYEPLKKEQFSFTKVVSNMSATKKITTEEAA